MNTNLKLSLLPTMPFDPAWLEQSAAFLHADPRMAKAGMKLIFAAWRGLPAASIPASHSFIAEASGLPMEVVAERYVALTDGFELREDGRLHHIHLAHVCAKMTAAYGKEIEAYTVAAAMAATDPEQFSLMSMEAVGTKKPRGITVMPNGFGYATYPKLREWAMAHGCPAPNQQDWLMNKFIDYVNSRSLKYKDWASAFRVWAENEMTKFKACPPEPIWPEGMAPVGAPASATGFPGQRSNASFFSGLAGRKPSRGEQAMDHNASVLAAARQRMGGQG